MKDFKSISPDEAERAGLVCVRRHAAPASLPVSAAILDGLDSGLEIVGKWDEIMDHPTQGKLRMRTFWGANNDA